MRNQLLTGNWDEKLHHIALLFLCLFAIFLSFSIAGTQISYSITLLLFLFLLLKGKISIGIDLQFKIPLLLLVIVGILATIFSLSPSESLYNLRKFLLIPIVVLIPAIIQTRKQLQVLLTAFLGTALLVALYGIGKYLFTISGKVIATQSTTMTWGAMSVFFVIGWASLLGVLRETRVRIVALVALIPQFAALVLSYVRGSFLSALLGLLVIGLLKQKKILLYILILFVILMIIFPTSVLDRIASIPDLSVGSTKLRLNQWRESIGIFLDYPILGVGWIDLHDVHIRHALPGADLSKHRFHIGHFHNNFVQVLMIMGSIGLIGFIWLFISILRQQWQGFRQTKQTPFLQAVTLLAFAGTIGFLFNGLFDWTFGDEEVVMILWFVIGLGLSAQKVYQQTDFAR